ncbi:MAG: ATP-binding protein [Candidatus Aminicenantaceae bacterium]
MAKTKILIVEDENIVANDIKNSLINLGYEVVGISNSGRDSIKKAEKVLPDLVLMDIVLKGNMDGIATAKQIQKKLKIPIIYLTAYSDKNTFSRAKITKPFGYILKPFEERELHITIEMALYRHKMEKNIRIEKEKAQKYLDIVGVLIIIIGSDMKINLINKKGCEILGYNNEKEIIGTNWFDIFVPEKIRSKLKQNFKKMLSGDIDGYESSQTSVLAKNGEEKFLSWDNVPLKDENGNINAILSSGVDITERIRAAEKIQKLNEQLEMRVKQRTHQLEEANKELEAFSYSISHDLQTPLRAIDGFSAALLEDHSDNLDRESKRLIHIIRNNTKRMEQLIHNLLHFFQTGKQEINITSINMNNLVKNVIQEITNNIHDRKLQWNISSLPPAHGDLAMIRQVFLNLLANALKFTRTRKTAIIQIKGQEGKEQNTYSVKDNGVGFDMNHINKLFDVFKRLHSTREFEGSGLGLAISQRIIQKHGGKIWAEGKRNKGATFYFSIPKSNK